MIYKIKNKELFMKNPLFKLRMNKENKSYMKYKI